ncbi:Glutamate-cysteine ligase family 2(GCS2) [Halorubrum xinjiangense]|uniref:Glutamate-cysteine ligase family 2(GCS2) n=1 Tax=Halorubrum xinjiangense TaxID=261291 RepID=A0A1G7JRZ2_9EURY|nr:glutamate-cysteine ligase family protein [Halorubrum xinjiangense]SDF27737.1 Glutamate-cysteine ligase family 2(GCS2) [Halorubrum xinjiangense]
MYTLTTGVELELWVVNERGRLCDGTEVIEAHPRIEPEFINPLIEVKTEPHTSERDLRRDLQSVLQTAILAAERASKRLVPLGTPLTEADPPANCERGRVFETVYGDGVRSAKNCAGTHIHFEREDAVDQLNLLTALDPALALTSSSPYYAGERRANSARALAYRTDCGDEFRCFTDLWEYADSLSEWRDRVDEKYERFKRLAADRGVSGETIEALFAPENTVLNPVRLRECQPTVEWRAPDATLPSQVVRLASDVERLVSRAATAPVEFGAPRLENDRLKLPEFEALRDVSRRAIESGLDSPTVESYLRELGFDTAAYDPLSSRLRGPPRLGESAARTRRLRQAGRLQADVQDLTDEETRYSMFPA